MQTPGACRKQRRTRGVTNMKVSRSMTDVNTFHALERAFSPERIQTYLAAAGGDQEIALQLYARNAQLGAAFHGPLQALEVALRNTMHARLESRYGSQWYANPAAGLDSHANDSIAGVLRRGAGVSTAGQFVASMSLGFWVRLVGRGGWVNGGRKVDYDRTLWRPALHRAFPGCSRRKVQRRLDSLRRLRNRIAHHEPIIGRDLDKDYDEFLEAVEWISADVRAWIERHSNLPSALRASLSAPARF